MQWQIYVKYQLSIRIIGNAYIITHNFEMKYLHYQIPSLRVSFRLFIEPKNANN